MISRRLISADGRFVAFESLASNLVAGDTNGAQDIFVHDRLTGATSRASVASGGTQASGDSGDVALATDGGVVGYESAASNLVASDTNAVNDISPPISVLPRMATAMTA